MRELATAAQMRELDRIAIEELGVPSMDLMERAARAVAEAVQTRLGLMPESCSSIYFLERPGGELTREERARAEAYKRRAVDLVEGKPGRRAAVFCGPGNNGGDGVAAARLLREAGVETRAFLVGERAKMTPDALEMERRLQAAGGALEDLPGGYLRQWEAGPRQRRWGVGPDEEEQITILWLSTCDVFVDAIFGVGLRRPPEGDFLRAIHFINASQVPVVAVDLPSGVDTDTGRVLGQPLEAEPGRVLSGAVEAAETVTFTMAKRGHYLGRGELHRGTLTVADIGVPLQALSDRRVGPFPVRAFEEYDLNLPRRDREAHKGDFGRDYILAGSVGCTGAPVLAARGAVRAGAGLVYLGVPEEIYPIVAVKCDEAMPHPLPEDGGAAPERAASCDAALLGPGLGRGEAARRRVLSLLRELRCPVVLDADGINALAGHIDVLDGREALTVLTPHEGEFARLTGEPLPVADRLGAALAFARAHGCVLALKGRGTVTAFPDGTAFINTSGNPGMAKGGSGDVLAGILTALLGQGLDPKMAVPGGVWLHGAAGDLCAEELGEYGMTPTDLVEALPRLLLRF